MCCWETSFTPEGSIVRVPLPRDILKTAAILGHKVS